MTDRGVYVKAGCWGWDTLDAFRKRLDSVYPSGPHGEQYRAAVAFAEVHARLWMPAVAPVVTRKRGANGRFLPAQ